MSNKAISLVLGSGGARGLAHVGVIRWLEEHGHKIRSISGCSIRKCRLIFDASIVVEAVINP